MSGGRLVLLASSGASTNVVYHALRRRCDDVHVLIEDGEPRLSFLRRRLRRLGIRRVLGQVAFMIFVRLVLRPASQRRIAEIWREHELDDSPIGDVIRVKSVNDDATHRVLRDLDPAVVVVNGTRIISSATLQAIAVPFINMHVGITPAYRGVHGGYWALFDGRPELMGTTIHVVDDGIDTGTPLAQVTLSPTVRDNFVTYPILQAALGIPLLLDVVCRAQKGNMEPLQSLLVSESRLRTHPTLAEYFFGRVRRGVR